MVLNQQDLCQQYQKVQVGTASQGRLILMMYDGAISFLQEAESKMADGDLAGKGLYLSRARSIISELHNALNFEMGKGIASSLSGLYTFINREITLANTSNEVQHVKHAVHVLENLRTGWRKIVLENGSGQEQDNRQRW